MSMSNSWFNDIFDETFETKEVQLLFKRNGIFVSVRAELNITDRDEDGFILEIFGDDTIIAHNFPRYSVFAYDKDKKPELVFTSENYRKAIDYWCDMDSWFDKIGG